MRESYYIEANMLLPFDVEWALGRVFHEEIINMRGLTARVSTILHLPDWDFIEVYE
jgi:hypothetical protein